MRDAVFLTGASGFIGAHVLRALLEAGYPVRALVRPEGRPVPAADGCQVVEGDLTRPGRLIPAMTGCRYLVHVAALYSFAPGQRRDVWRTNVQGTAGLLEAARLAGVERAIVTSSSATVGAASPSAPAVETAWATGHGGLSAYHGSKILQERAALAARLPVVAVLPTTPVGPGDARPTPTGKMIVDFMRGKLFGYIPGGMNLVPVEDVARAHVLALEHGLPGERYLAGGENLTLAEIWQALAAICHRPPPTWRVPYRLAWAFGWADELRCRVRKDAQPLAPLEGVQMAPHYMFVDCAKARRELGYAPGPVTDALERAVGWFYEHGYA